MELNKSILKYVLAGMAIGLLWFVVIRALFFYPEHVHYHANFAVFINGEREQFESPIYYEDTLACSQDETDNPRGRVHLHQPNNDVVHVHDHAATWGNFFENIGWALGNSFIKTDTELFQDRMDGELVFILNGERTRQVADRVIGNEDRLLISFGDASDTELETQFAAIADDAGQFNTKPDPASCSGPTNPSILERLRFGLLG